MLNHKLAIPKVCCDIRTRARKFFEVQYNYPSLCESRMEKLIINELMDDYNGGTFLDASNGPYESNDNNNSITMPTGDEKIFKNLMMKRVKN